MSIKDVISGTAELEEEVAVPGGRAGCVAVTALGGSAGVSVSFFFLRDLEEGLMLMFIIQDGWWIGKYGIQIMRRTQNTEYIIECAKKKSVWNWPKTLLRNIE